MLGHIDADVGDGIEIRSLARQAENHLPSEGDDSQTCCDDNPDDANESFDDLSGDVLDPAIVKQARNEDVDYVSERHAVDKVPLADCFEQTGKAPLERALD